MTVRRCLSLRTTKISWLSSKPSDSFVVVVRNRISTASLFVRPSASVSPKPWSRRAMLARPTARKQRPRKRPRDGSAEAVSDGGRETYRESFYVALGAQTFYDKVKGKLVSGLDDGGRSFCLHPQFRNGRGNAHTGATACGTSVGIFLAPMYHATEVVGLSALMEGLGWAAQVRQRPRVVAWAGRCLTQSAPRWQVRLAGIVVASGCPGLWLSCLPTDLLPTSDAGFYALVLHLGRQGCLGEVCRSEKTCMSCRRFGPVGRDDRCSECVGVGPCLCPCRPKSLATSTFGPKTQARHGLSPSHPCLAPPTR